MATPVHAKSTFVSVDGDDISSFTNSSELSYSAETHDITAYGNDAHAYTPGLNDATFSCEGWYDSTASTGTRGTLLATYQGNAAVTVIHRPEGTGSSLPQNSFSAVMTSYVETNAVDDIVMWSAEFQVSGDIDTTAQSA